MRPWLWLAAGVGLLAGCSSTPSQPVQNQSAALVSQVSALEAELKQLRNTVEQQQYELENMKRRQGGGYSYQNRQMPAAGTGAEADAVAPQSSPEAPGGEITGVEPSSEMAASATESAAVEPAPVEPPLVEPGPVDAAPVAPPAPAPAEMASAPPALAPTVSQPAPTAEQAAYDAAFESLKQGRYEEATSGFKSFADTYPASQLADDAYYWMSEARYVNREFEGALNGFKTVVARYPDSGRVPEALLKVGYIQYDIGAYSDAAATFRDIITQFPGHQVAASAESRLKRIEGNTN